MKLSRFLTILAFAITTITAAPTPTATPTAPTNSVTAPDQATAVLASQASQLIDNVNTEFHQSLQFPRNRPMPTPGQPYDTILDFPNTKSAHPAPECHSPKCRSPILFPPGHPTRWVAQTPALPTGHPVNVSRRLGATEEKEVPKVRNTNKKPFLPYCPNTNITLEHGPKLYPKPHFKTITKTVARTNVVVHSKTTSPLVSYYTPSPTCTSTMRTFKHGHLHWGPTTVYNSTITSTSSFDCSGCALTMKTLDLGHGPVQLHHRNLTVTKVSTKVVVECRPSSTLL